MPEPCTIQLRRLNPTIQNEMSFISFNLRRSAQYIHDGVEYKFDFEEYEIRTDRGRSYYHQAQNDYDCGHITKTELDEIADSYFKDICTYNLIDEDGKECGTFDSMTREYYIYRKRIELDGLVYYYDSDREVRTYGNSCIGILSEDGSEIIRYNS